MDRIQLEWKPKPVELKPKPVSGLGPLKCSDLLVHLYKSSSPVSPEQGTYQRTRASPMLSGSHRCPFLPDFRDAFADCGVALRGTDPESYITEYA